MRSEQEIRERRDKMRKSDYYGNLDMYYAMRDELDWVLDEGEKKATEERTYGYKELESPE